VVAHRREERPPPQPVTVDVEEPPLVGPVRRVARGVRRSADDIRDASDFCALDPMPLSPNAMKLTAPLVGAVVSVLADPARAEPTKSSYG
jgi:hypothetical protein